MGLIGWIFSSLPATDTEGVRGPRFVFSLTWLMIGIAILAVELPLVWVTMQTWDGTTIKGWIGKIGLVCSILSVMVDAEWGKKGVGRFAFHLLGGGIIGAALLTPVLLSFASLALAIWQIIV